MLNYNIINKLKPCYDPIKYISKDWKGSLIDLLKNKNIPAKDRLWVCVRRNFMTDLQLKYYALEVAKACVKNTKDERVHNCLKVMAKFLKNKASLEELKVARLVAWSAAWSAGLAAESVVWSAWSAMSAAKSAAESAARSAAKSAAESVVWSAWSAAELAAKSAAESAAKSAAELAAKSAAEENQCLILIKILKRKDLG